MSGSPSRILVVEDDASVRAGLASSLGASGNNLGEGVIVNGPAMLGVRNRDALKGYVQETLTKDDSIALPDPSPSGSS
jgi:CheY-like chemotaxis protein